MEDQRAEKWEEDKASGLKEKAPIIADVDDFQDEVASYRAKTKKIKMVGLMRALII